MKPPPFSFFPMRGRPKKTLSKLVKKQTVCILQTLHQHQSISTPMLEAGNYYLKLTSQAKKSILAPKYQKSSFDLIRSTPSPNKLETSFDEKIEYLWKNSCAVLQQKGEKVYSITNKYALENEELPSDRPHSFIKSNELTPLRIGLKSLYTLYRTNRINF